MMDWRHCVAVAVCSDCEVLGLWLRAQFRSSSCLAAGFNRDSVVKSVGGTVLAVAVFSDCYKILRREKGALFGRRAAWRPGSCRWVSPSSRCAPRCSGRSAAALESSLGVGRSKEDDCEVNVTSPRGCCCKGLGDTVARP